MIEPEKHVASKAKLKGKAVRKGLSNGTAHVFGGRLGRDCVRQSFVMLICDLLIGRRI